jgi:WD40 repeat protein
MKTEVEKIALFTGHADCIYTIEPAETPETFFSAGGDGMVVKWNINAPDTGNLIARIPFSVYALCYDKDSNHLVVAQNNEGLHLIDIDSRVEIQSLKLLPTAIFDLQSYENDLFAGLGSGNLIIIDRTRFSVKKDIKVADKSLRSLAVNPLKGELAAGFSDNYIRIFDLKTLVLKKEWEAHTNSVFTLAYSPDYQFLVSGGRDARIMIWDAVKFENITAISAHLFAINHLSFSPSGQYFVTGSMDKAIKIWETGSFKLLKVIDKARHAGHGTSVNKTLWTDYEGTIITASDDRTLSGWRVKMKEV